MDLTKSHPHSVHDKWQGVVQLARTIDKGKAVAHGNIGEYHYNCSMDQAAFSFLGVDHEGLLNAIKSAKSDADIETYTRSFIEKKTPAEIESWNHAWVTTPPTGESLEYMTKVRKELAPERNDVVTWADVLDLEEGRPVREHAAV